MKDCATLAGFFEATDFNTMAPRDDLGNTGTWVLAAPGRSYLAYRMTGGGFTLSGLTAGTYLLRWVDTVTGITIEEQRSVTAGTGSFFRPMGIGSETAVWLTKLSDSVQNSRAIPPVLFLLREK